MEKQISFKFLPEYACEYGKLTPGRVFIRLNEGSNGNIYVKSDKKGAAPFNLTRFGLMVFPSDRETVIPRTF